MENEKHYLVAHFICGGKTKTEWFEVSGAANSHEAAFGLQEELKKQGRIVWVILEAVGTQSMQETADIVADGCLSGVYYVVHLFEGDE